jgi:O-antigen biosynthesis protein
MSWTSSTLDGSGLATLVDPEQHPSALERAAIAALSVGDLKHAFALADRRCRILPKAQARHYTLRAEIASRRGFATAALADISKALELAPDDRAANRRMMQWGEGAAREAAARRLLRIDQDFEALTATLAALKTSKDAGFGAVYRIGDRISGWVAWRGRGRPRLRIEQGERVKRHVIESDPQHPLSQAADHAASFSAPFVQGTTRSVVRLLLGRHEIARQDFPAPPGLARPAAASGEARIASDRVTIIVPVYDDFDATERCLKSLTRAIGNDNKVSLLLVDDATPDPRIANLLDGLASLPKVQLLRNEHNLGFIGAVNRALHTISTDDVILVNADTIVPDDFASRLRAIAYSSSDIGTVTPLSNNGESASLPRPFVANPLPDEAEIRLLDSVAARANAGRVIDMPDGIGFCLYIKRACLDAVGGLSEHYHRGYLEDVDLCLRAREHGFRNVCATSVYVGHVGSASFKVEKRALVVLNLERLRLRFPEYRTGMAVFKALDPLKVGRAAIERSLAADHRDALVVLTGPGVPAATAVHYAQACGRPALIATLAQETLTLRDAGDGFPQSLSFALPAKRAALAEAIRNFAFSRIVVADPGRIPRHVAAELAANGTPLDILVADGGLWCRRGGLDSNHNPCPALTRGRICTCGDIGREARDWLESLSSDSRIIAPDPIAAALLRRRLTSSRAKQIHLADKTDLYRKMERPRDVAAKGQTFGLLAIGHAPADFSLMHQLARRIRKVRPHRQIVVFGETLDDLALMALGNVTVTGACDAGELGNLAERYELAGLAIARRAPLFGHPIMATAFRDIDVPLAFVDWSFGRCRIAGGDLALPPASDENASVAELMAWSAEW